MQRGKQPPIVEPKPCAMCLGTNLPIRNSHIIAEFNYKGCYDEKHRMVVLRNYEVEKERPMQKGFREYLLCDACEGKISKWEDYAKRILTAQFSVFQSTPAKELIEVQTDYAKFKLYAMSTLWRMGITSLKEFGAVRLGPHAERLRQALHAEDPLGDQQYPIVLMVPLIKGKFFPDFVAMPSSFRANQLRCYANVIGGIHHNFFVGSHPLRGAFGEAALNEKGELKIPILSTADIPHLDQTLREHGEILRGERKRLPRSTMY